MLKSRLQRTKQMNWKKSGNRKKFNRDKYQVLHLGKNNQLHKYTTGNN